MNSITNNAFKYKNGATRYTHIKVGRNISYFTIDPLNSDNKYTASDICKMIEFLVGNIYARFGGQLFNNAFKYKNGATQYTHIKVGRNESYFTIDPLNGDNKYTANDICKMTEFLVDNIYVRFGG